MHTPIAAAEDRSHSSVSEGHAHAVGGDRSQERRVEFDGLVPHLLPRFRRMAMRWLRHPEDAEDAVQDALLSAFRHLAQFDGRAQMSTWLTAILHNAVRMQIRRRMRCQVLVLGEISETSQLALSEILTDPRPTPEQVLERRELRDIVRKLRRTLPRSQQAALKLRLQDDLSIREAAQALGAPVGTVKAHLSRGRTTLRKRFHAAVRTLHRQGGAWWEIEQQSAGVTEFPGSRRGGSSVPA